MESWLPFTSFNLADNRTQAEASKRRFDLLTKPCKNIASIKCVVMYVHAVMYFTRSQI